MSTTSSTPSTARSTAPALQSLARPSGAFAMVAVDHREAMRAMFAQHQQEPVSDQQVTDFKLAAARALTPYASAVLLDKQFVLDRALEEEVVASNCALIAAADEFIPSADELVADARIDAAVDPGHYREAGVKALKLLVIHRPDAPAEPRVAMVTAFVERCRAHGLLCIIEPVSRPPLGGGDWDWDAGVLAAAEELGSLGADLYKAEMPLHGEGEEQQLTEACARIGEAVSSPWVVLSSGVHRDRFPDAVDLSCRAGASGFLAGRAVWSACIGASDPVAALEKDAVRRLQRLVEVVDAAVLA